MDGEIGLGKLRHSLTVHLVDQYEIVAVSVELGEGRRAGTEIPLLHLDLGHLC
jgi:hypothetical protein